MTDTTQGTDRVFVAAERAFEDEPRQFVTVGSSEIAVVLTDDEYHAVLNRCPHQKGPIGEGLISCSFRMREGGRGVADLTVDPERRVISCPWHGWPFDLETGIHVTEPEYRIPTFEVEVDDGDVFVRV